MIAQYYNSVPMNDSEMTANSFDNERSPTATRASDRNVRLCPFPPQDPLPEIQQPIVEAGLRDVEIEVIPYDDDVVSTRHAFLMNQNRPTQAYLLDLTKQQHVPISHPIPGWGYMYVGYCLRSGGVIDGVFDEFPPDRSERVSIKCLSKSVVHIALAQTRTMEDPYKDVLRMQTIGDNIHVLGCIEALEDDMFLYIISPYCEYSLADYIVACHKRNVPPDGEALENRTRDVFAQILQNLRYLHNHGICHRNISVNSFTFYQGRAVLKDLGSSFRMPILPEESTSLLLLTRPLRGRTGNVAYQSPEVYLGLPFDAKVCDLWASAVVLFQILTGRLMYNTPQPEDPFFRYFILAQGLSRPYNRYPDNVLAAEVMTSLAVESHLEHAPLSQLAAFCSTAVSRDVLDVLGGLLHIRPTERWTLDHVETCRWMRSRPV